MRRCSLVQSEPESALVSISLERKSFLKMPQPRREKKCYLCHYPVVDGGVKLHTLDQKKLSKWWLENLQNTFEIEGKKNRSICKFCVWDAR
jgi:hypothetical protein